jgi:uncharacterized protein YlxW (UPF0749 family)
MISLFHYTKEEIQKMRKAIPTFLIICILTGFLLAFQFTTQNKNASFNAVSQRNNNLITIIHDLEKEIANQEDQIEAMRAQLNDLQSTHNKGKLQDLQTTLAKAKVEAGLTPVVGKGIIITIDDNQEGMKANPNDDPNKYIVHDEHLLNLVNELRIGSAEAIAINGHRLITTSEIRCVGNLINVDMSRVAPPYEIRAIGSPKLMIESISMGKLAELENDNYPITIEESEHLVIPAYRGDLQFKYTNKS